MAAAGITGDSAVAGSCATTRPPRCLTRAAPAAPSALAPVSTTASARLAVAVGGRLEEHVDRRPRVQHARVDRQREVSLLDEQVIVGRRQVDVCRRGCGSLSPASRSGSAECSCNRRVSSDCGPQSVPRCCTTAIGSGKSGLRPCRISLKRLHAAERRADHDDPDGLPAATAPPSRSSWSPEDPFVLVEHFVVGLVRRAAHRLLAAERRARRSGAGWRYRSSCTRFCSCVVEVDHHVAAEDEVELVEAAVGDQVVLREDDVLAQRLRGRWRGRSWPCSSRRTSRARRRAGSWSSTPACRRARRCRRARAAAPPRSSRWRRCGSDRRGPPPAAGWPSSRPLRPSSSRRARCARTGSCAGAG